MHIRHSVMLIILANTVVASGNSRKPTITHGATETFGYDKQPVTLQCRIQSIYPAEVNWYKNGSIISQSPNYRIDSTNQPNGLLISELVTHISSQTVGSYYCNASNSYGWSVSSNANVFTAYIENEFLREPQSKTASVGETVIFSCQPPNGSPKPSVTWFKDKKEVIFSQRIQLIDGNDLRIEQIAWGDAGSYTCVATSLAFEKSSSPALLRVRQRPYFLVAPESQTVPINGAVELACHVSGDPQPSITWRRDPPVPTIPSSRSVLLSDGSLKITNVQLEDAGDYMCQASSEGGVVEAVAHLTITSPPGFVLTPPGNAVFLEGTRVNLACIAIGSPTPEIRWIAQKTSEYFLYGIKMRNSRIIVTETGSLIINAARLSDSGIYECRASSPSGFTRTVTHLFIQPNPHLFPGRVGVVSMSPVKLTNFLRQEETELVCAPPNLREFYEYMTSADRNATEVGQFNPQTTFKTSWYKEEKEIQLSVASSDRFRLTADNSLVISPVMKNDIGNYSCMIMGLMNKRIAFWHFQLLMDLSRDPYMQPNPATSKPNAPTNLKITGVGDTWIYLSWDYESNGITDIRFTVFYLLQFHNSSYVSTRRVNTFNSVRITEGAAYPKQGPSIDLGTIDDGQYPLDLWQISGESIREKKFRLTGLVPNSGYWVEVRAATSHLWSRGALFSQLVYTSYSPFTFQPPNPHSLDLVKGAVDFQDLSARVHSLMFLGVSARSLSSSEMLVSWTVRTTNGAVRLIDGFQVVAKPVFMSRCSARATSPARDQTNSAFFEVSAPKPTPDYTNYKAGGQQQAHCSFNTGQLVERFRRVSVNGGENTLGKERSAEKFLIVYRSVSREEPSTGAVLGGLQPFTCYEVTVKAFKDDYTYGRIWSRETPAELMLSLDAAPSQAPRLISAKWLGLGVSETSSSLLHANFLSNSSQNGGIRLNWSPLELHLAHGTLIGYSIHLIANDSSYTQSQKVRRMMISSLIWCYFYLILRLLLIITL